MKRLITLFVLFTLCVAYNAQSQDSLKLKRLQQAYENAADDSVRLGLLMNLLSSNMVDDVDTALAISETALSFATKLDDSLNMAISNHAMSRYYTVLSDYKNSLRHDLEALAISKYINNVYWQSIALNGVGEDYYNLDLYNDAFKYYRESLDLSIENKLPLREAIALYNMGRVLIVMGQLDKARDYIEESLVKSEKVGDTVGIAYSKHDLARIDIEKGDYETAFKSLEEAYEISSGLREDVLTPQIMITLALANEESGKYRAALIHYDEAMKLYDAQNNKNGIAQALFGKGSVSKRMSDQAKAMSYFKRSLAVAKDIDDHEMIIKCFEVLSELYEEANNLEYALSFYKKFKQLEDSVFSEKKKEQFSQVQIQYETAKKDMEIKLLYEKEQQQVSQLKNEEFIRNILVVILAFTAVLLYSLYKNNKKRQKINEVLVQQQQEIKSKSKELEGLLEMKDKFFSILSHDLRSPINALTGVLDILDEGYMTQEELKEVSKSLKSRLTKTRKLLDTLLDWAMLQMDAIKINNEEIKLVDMVEDNLNFFREVEDKKIKYINNVPESDKVKADRNMLDLIIRNLVSNAIKFTDNGGEVKVGTETSKDGQLIVAIEDNGIGMSKDRMDKLFDTGEIYTTRGTANERGTGLGLKLCKEFVERMGGNILVESTEGKGSIFKFTIQKA